MKTKNYFKKAMLLFLVCSAQFIMAQVPSYVPTNGLVTYYPFNGNANDLSGNGYNGTNNGATLTTDRFGNVNSAYSFNGATNKIVLPLQQNNITAYSVSAWFKTSTGGPILSGRGLSNQVGLTLHSYSGIPRYIADGPNVSIGKITNNAYADNQWHNIVGVFNGAAGVINSSQFSIYIDNVLVAQSNLTSTTSSVAPINNGTNLLIGAHQVWTNEAFYNGIIDDLGIWNRALTQQEITAMYNGVTYNDTCNAVSGSLTQGLVGYWPFCGNANDDSGIGNNGTINGATLTTDRFGNSNSAYSFNGVSNTISYNSTFVFNQNNDGALSFWFENESILSNIYSTLFFSKTTLGENNRYNLYLQPLPNNLLRLTLDYRESNSNLHILNTYQPITNNVWNNLVISRSLNVYSLYLNGILVGTVTDTNPNLPNEIGWLIGSNPNGFGVPIFYKGKIDDIGFWDRALTPSEVTQLYNQNQCFTNTIVTDTLVINVGQLSFTNPISYANNITIFPNPASTQVNIAFNNISDLNGGSIKIINSLGQQVATTPITTSGTNTTMTLSTWGGSGLYFVQIVNPQGQIVDIKKILLQ